MKLRPTLFLSGLILSALALLSCNKTKITSITGIVVDKANNQPLPGVTVGLSASGLKVDEYLGADTVKSGSDGTFSMSIETEKPNSIGFYASIDGYMRKPYTPIPWGDQVEQKIEMYPIDAYLKVFAKNAKGVSDKVYYLLRGEFYENTTSYCQPWPIKQMQGDSLENNFNVPGGQFVKICWGYSDRVTTNHYDGIDSVFCARNDTTIHVLKY